VLVKRRSEMDQDNEVRCYTMEELRVDPAAGSGDGSAPGKIVGYAAVFGVLSEDLGGFREMIQRGAFAHIQEDDVRALFNHDPNYILGRSKNKTLTLVEDERGLRIEILPADTQYARDLVVSIQRGDINQMSFAFRTIKDSWAQDVDKNGKVTDVRRTLEEVRLFDVSPVTYPAYPQTTVAVRDMVKSITTQAGSADGPQERTEVYPGNRERLLRLKVKEWDKSETCPYNGG